MFQNNTAESRYELDVEGKTAFATYRLEGDTIKIMHVETPPELRGQGVAAKVMAGVVDDVKSRGLTLVPICPYAVEYLKRHPL